MFSSRLPRDLSPNTLSRAVQRVRASGDTILNLTESNPTAVAIPFQDDTVTALADRRAEAYAPDPRGMLLAREAVVRSYRARADVSAAAVTLTASTSEAYAFLFKLLCNPGDTVLVPQPSYPLFDLLTRLEGVDGAPYRLDPLGDWCLDRESIAAAAGPRAKALLLVSPNNPTGSMLSRSDREWVVGFAAERGLALIADEVFIDYPLSPRPDAVSLLGESRALTLTLGGLSKSAGLPQMKLAWIVMSGPPDLVQTGAARLDVIADTYLSVSTPVQCAAPEIIEIGAGRRRVIHDRVRRNLAQLRASVAAHPAVTFCDPEGGWSAILRVPDLESEEQLVLRLLNEARVLVHPGYFFDLHAEAYLVLSLLPAPEVFDEGVSRLLRLVSGRQS